MKNNIKLRYCVVLNFILFFIILTVILLCKNEDNSYITYGPNDKLYVLTQMLATLPITQFIVYVNSKKNAEILQNFLEEENYSVLIITSSMTKFERAEIISQFKKGGIKCLISTDLLSRGIDIQQLSLVINYDLPKPDNIQNYIHRIGRTGRYGRNGLSINLVSKYEMDIQNLI